MEGVGTWKPVSGYEGYYQVSISGCIRRIKAGQGTKAANMKTYTGKNGYVSVRLCVGGKSKLHLVHRLVAESFLSNPEALPCVNHLDGNKCNNHANNLEWVSYSDNMKHSFENELHPKGEGHYKCRLTDEDALNIRLSSENAESLKIRYGISQQYISQLRRGDRRR